MQQTDGLLYVQPNSAIEMFVRYTTSIMPNPLRLKFIERKGVHPCMLVDCMQRSVQAGSVGVPSCTLRVGRPTQVAPESRVLTEHICWTERR